jgi:hypothetical protein
MNDKDASRITFNILMRNHNPGLENEVTQFNEILNTISARSYTKVLREGNHAGSHNIEISQENELHMLKSDVNELLALLSTTLNTKKIKTLDKFVVLNRTVHV